jgi:hydroxymethylpyrimidine pyrophosphatase-like HAD family hydrolase
MDTLLKFRWLIALILIIGAMIYFNERQSKKGISPELVDSLLKWQEQKTGLLIDLTRAQVADSLLRGQITDYVNAEKPILNTYEKYKKEYSTKTPTQTDKELIDWSRK